MAILLLVALIGLASRLMLDQASAARQRVASARYEVQAQAMARSGLRYAEAMIVHGRWRTSTSYDSPALGQGERFQVKARRVGSQWLIESVGQVGAVTVRMQERW